MYDPFKGKHLKLPDSPVREVGSLKDEFNSANQPKGTWNADEKQLNM